MRTDSLQQFVNLRRQLSEERGRLQQRLSQLNEALGELQQVASTVAAAAPSPASQGRGGKRTMSPEARARIAAAQRARWAAQKGGKAAPAKASNGNASGGAFDRPKRKMSAAGRRAIAEAARRRWASAKAAGKRTL